MAQLRMERAISTCESALNSGSDITTDEFERSIKRIVIAVNTIAQALSNSEINDDTTRSAADILWQLGEGLHWMTDGARD